MWNNISICDKDAISKLIDDNEQFWSLFTTQ